MDLTTLRAVLSDLRPKLLPSRFEKAQQPDPATLQLGFRSLQGMLWLELSWQADAPRLVQIPPPPRQGAGSTLSQQIQHSLRQMALIELVQTGFERVVEFRMAPRPGDAVQRVLVLELMGRHSNLLLLDEQRQVVALGRQVRDHQSRVRPIGTGDAYLPPPPLQGQAPSSTEGFERWRERLRLLPLPLRKALPQAYQGISPPLARQLAGELLATSVEQLEHPHGVSCIAIGRPGWPVSRRSNSDLFSMRRGIGSGQAIPINPATLKATKGTWPSPWVTGIEPGLTSAICIGPATSYVSV